MRVSDTGGLVAISNVGMPRREVKDGAASNSAVRAATKALAAPRRPLPREKIDVNARSVVLPRRTAIVPRAAWCCRKEQGSCRA
jgi:hypothetical protein